MFNTNVHVPVLLDPILGFAVRNFDYLEGITVFDATLGGGGYTAKFIELGAQVQGSDLDIAVINELSDRFNKNTFEAHHGNFSEVISSFENSSFDIVMADLGFSSNQLESSDRGFSYKNLEEEFDLRYDVATGQPAWKFICAQPVDNLGKTIYKYSGERLSFRIARVLKAREPKTVGEAVDAVTSGIPGKYKNKTKGILSRVWQALRIQVNDELSHLGLFLERSTDKIKPGGLLMIVCFHSLEDKLVTNYMRRLAKPVSEDEYGNKNYDYQLLTKKAIQPTEKEVECNVRSRSATLRILKRL